MRGRTRRSPEHAGEAAPETEPLEGRVNTAVERQLAAASRRLREQAGELEREADARAAALDERLAEHEDGLGRAEDEMRQAMRELGEEMTTKLNAEIDRRVAEADQRLRAASDALVGELSQIMEAHAEVLGRGARGLASGLSGAALHAEHEQSDGAAGDGSGGISRGLELLVAQMASAGSERDEIAEMLRRDFEIGDADAVVATVLDSGSESGGEEPFRAGDAEARS